MATKCQRVANNISDLTHSGSVCRACERGLISPNWETRRVCDWGFQGWIKLTEITLWRIAQVTAGLTSILQYDSWFTSIDSPDDWTTASFFCTWVYYLSHDVGNRVCKIIYFLIPNQIIDVKRGVCGKQTAQTTTRDIHAARHLPHSKHTSLCTWSEHLNVAAVNRVSKFIFILVCFHTAN